MPSGPSDEMPSRFSSSMLQRPAQGDFVSPSEVRKKTFVKLEVCCELVILYMFIFERDGIGLYTQSIDIRFSLKQK
jgi:hypothetical protein